MTGTWIRFNYFGTSDTGKTAIWQVVSRSAIGVLLGEVKWYGPWRKYSFFPNRNCDLVFEQVCLRDIADFCLTMTNQHNQHIRGKRKAKAA